MESSKEYILDGLCCGNCAAKIEEEAKKLPGIVSATVNFVSKNMVVTFDDSMNAEELTAQISKIAKRHDSGIEVSENHPQKAFMDDAAEKKKHSYKQSIRRFDLIMGAAVYAAALLVTVPEHIALVLLNLLKQVKS